MMIQILMHVNCEPLYIKCQQLKAARLKHAWDATGRILKLGKEQWEVAETESWEVECVWIFLKRIIIGEPRTRVDLL